MKNTKNTTKFVMSGAILAAVFVAFIAVFPGVASANYGYYEVYPYDSYCAYPQTAYVAPNGYYTCRYPSGPAYQPAPAPQPVYNPLTASCYASQTNVIAGQGVQWVASASGGYSSYSYNWFGTDGLSGSGQSVYMNYWNPGTKTASVVVYSGGQSVTVNCGNSVYVNQPMPIYQPQPVYAQPVYQQPAIINTNISGLDIGCYAEPVTARINQPVTWNVEVVGGVGPYKYAWVGSDGLESGSQTAIKFYQTAGYKSALVTVYSADGRQATKACSNSVNVGGAATTVKKAAPKPVTTCAPCTTAQTSTGKEGDNSSYTASAPGSVTLSPNGTASNASGTRNASEFFSFNNVPWGWVAVLIIIILFIACMYLVFNKPKI